MKISKVDFDEIFKPLSPKEKSQLRREKFFYEENQEKKFILGKPLYDINRWSGEIYFRE